MTISHDREQPCPSVRAAQGVKAAESAQKGLLYDVVRLARGARQPARKAVRSVQVRHHLRLETTTFVIH